MKIQYFVILEITSWELFTLKISCFSGFSHLFRLPDYFQNTFTDLFWLFHSILYLVQLENQVFQFLKQFLCVLKGAILKWNFNNFEWEVARFIVEKGAEFLRHTASEADFESLSETHPPPSSLEIAVPDRRLKVSFMACHSTADCRKFLKFKKINLWFGKFLIVKCFLWRRNWILGQR